MRKPRTTKFLRYHNGTSEQAEDSPAGLAASVFALAKAAGSTTATFGREADAHSLRQTSALVLRVTRTQAMKKVDIYLKPS